MLKGGVDFVVGTLKARTVAFISEDDQVIRERATLLTSMLEAAGVKVVGSKFIQVGTTDVASYLTKLKYQNPDVVFVNSGVMAFHFNLFEQVATVGGWGNIKYFSLYSAGTDKSVMAEPAAEGSYRCVTWTPLLQNPGTAAFMNDFRTVLGRDADAINVYHNYCLRTAVEAIKIVWFG